MSETIDQGKISQESTPDWKSIFSTKEYSYLTHVINGLIIYGEIDNIFIQYGEKDNQRILHIFEPFAILNSLGFSSPSVVSIVFNNSGKIEFLAGDDNGYGISSDKLKKLNLLDFPRNSTLEIDFWHFVDAIGTFS